MLWLKNCVLRKLASRIDNTWDGPFILIRKKTNNKLWGSFMFD